MRPGLQHQRTEAVRRAMRGGSVAASGLVAAAMLTIGAAPAAPADEPVRTPQLDQVFTPFVQGAFAGAHIASEQEAVAALNLGQDDPWYDEPQLAGTERPGTLLKSEQVTVMFAGVQPADIDAYRVMYVTETPDGDPIISTGILMIPADGMDNADRSIVGYQMANDSVGAYCDPSNMWTGGDPADGASWSALGPLAQMFSQGAAVMISDVGNAGDLKPHGVFAGKFAGRAMLDGLRTATQVEDAGLSPDAPIGLFGIAGGGVGAAQAAQMQADYAPDLDVRATVLEGMVVNQRNFMRTADGSVGSGFAFANLLGLEPFYPDMDIDAQLNPQGEAIADWYRTQCQTPAYFTMPFVPLAALFTSGQSPADIPSFQRAFDDNVLGEQAPASKVLISSCVGDDSPMSLVPAQDSRDLADEYRAGGTDVTYAPSDCSMSRLLTNAYGWGTDLFGMQTVDWLIGELG